MTAGRFSRPLRRPVVIAPDFSAPDFSAPDFSAPNFSAPAFTAQAPLASLAGSVLGPRFHAWYGGSGRRMICSVFPVLETDAAKGLPDFDAAIVIAAKREGNGRLQAVGFFALGKNEAARAQVEAAISAGASEWHVHLLAADEEERRALLRDLEARGL